MSENCHKKISRHRYKSPKLTKTGTATTEHISIERCETKKKHGNDNKQSAQRKISRGVNER